MAEGGPVTAIEVCQVALQELDRRVKAGAKPEQLVIVTPVKESQGDAHRCLRAIVTGPLCLACHGSIEQQSPELRAAFSLRKAAVNVR